MIQRETSFLKVDFIMGHRKVSRIAYSIKFSTLNTTENFDLKIFIYFFMCSFGTCPASETRLQFTLFLYLETAQKIFQKIDEFGIFDLFIT